jgi:catechol 2,3-dioxygenase-like lactoylglutathione lyase family enzyme
MRTAKIISGYGVRPKAFFWIGRHTEVLTGTHIAFAAPDRSAVDAFYEAAIAAGGRDNGAPGLRPQYAPTYYGAFVLDPDGHNIEAVCYAQA